MAAHTHTNNPYTSVDVVAQTIKFICRFFLLSFACLVAKMSCVSMAIVHSCQKMCVWGRKSICVHLFTFFREKRPQRPIPRPPLKPRQNCWPPQPPRPPQPPNSPPQLNTPPSLRQLLQLRVLAEQELQALPRRKKPPQPTMTSSFGSRPNGGQSCRCLWCVGVARCEHTKHREAQCAHLHRWYRGLLYAHQACPPSASTITSSLTQWTEDCISFSVFCLQKGSPEVNQCMNHSGAKPEIFYLAFLVRLQTRELVLTIMSGYLQLTLRWK